MRCPSCNHYKTEVVDSRPRADRREIFRRRRCLKCNKKFTTTEVQFVSFSHKTMLEGRIRARVRALGEGLLKDLELIAIKGEAPTSVDSQGTSRAAERVKRRLLARAEST